MTIYAKLYYLAGVDNKPTTFLFTDNQVVEESFLEDVNNIFSLARCPISTSPRSLRKSRVPSAKWLAKRAFPKPQELFRLLIERVRNNLHVVLCMSPIGDAFRNPNPQYPAFVNCTTIDWFQEWPKDALLEVAERYLEGVELGEERMRTSIATIFMTMHRSVSTQKMLEELKRHNYVTPTNYPEISGYKGLLNDKRKEIGDQVSKLRNGLFKIDDTREKVEKNVNRARGLQGQSGRLPEAV